MQLALHVSVVTAPESQSSPGSTRPLPHSIIKHELEQSSFSEKLASSHSQRLLTQNHHHIRRLDTNSGTHHRRHRCHHHIALPSLSGESRYHSAAKYRTPHNGLWHAACHQCHHHIPRRRDLTIAVHRCHHDARLSHVFRQSACGGNPRSAIGNLLGKNIGYLIARQPSVVYCEIVDDATG